MDTTRNPPFRMYYGGLSTTRDMFEAETFFPAIEFSKVPFDLPQVQRALFESTYRNPITLLFPRESAHIIKIATDITMTVELAHAIYSEYEGDDETPPPECYDTPEWYLRGVAHFTGPTGEPETAPAHAFLPIEEDNSIGSAVIQIVTDQDRLKGGAAAPGGE
jgi:hypothetical protein